MAIKTKSRQKKFDTRIDFTPMVDMNMLLITFFMLCTTMIKSQTLQIALPTNEKVEKEQQNKVKESEAITIIIDGKVDEKTGKALPEEGMLYYYEGKPETANLAQGESNMKQAEFEVNDLKKKWKENGFSKDDKKNDSVYNVERKKVMNDSTLKRPVVISKATPNASYANVVSVLDEMQINDINRYQIDRMNEVDSAMMIMVKAKNELK